jgi:hypothetical protein
LLALLLAFGAQSLVAGLATEVFLRKEIASSARHGWLALAIAALLFSLHHGYSLELALRTGLYDLRQALISALAALLLATPSISSGGGPEGAGFGHDPVQSLVVASGWMLSRRLISKPTPTASGRGESAASVRSK